MKIIPVVQILSMNLCHTRTELCITTISSHLISYLYETCGHSCPSKQGTHLSSLSVPSILGLGSCANESDATSQA